MESIEERLQEIKIEDYIWVIYIIIIILSWYANSKEEDYLINNNNKSKEEYRNIMIFIFAVLVIIYFYFTKDSYNGVKNLKNTDTEKKKYLMYASFIGSLLILISGVIFLFIAILDEDIDVELAFN